MNRIIEIAKKNWPYIVGAIVGGVGGYLYWYFIGCTSGTCPHHLFTDHECDMGRTHGQSFIEYVFWQEEARVAHV